MGAAQREREAFQKASDERFSALSDDELRKAYRSWRTQAFNASGGRMAASFGRCLAKVEAIEKVADQRRISLL